MSAVNPLSYQQVVLATTTEDAAIIEGRVRPQRVLSQIQESAIYLCDARQKIFGESGFKFTVHASADITRARQCRVSKAILPKLPNINPLNNQFVIVHENGTTGTITLAPGFYNQVSIVNELKNKIDAEFALLSPPDSVAVAFNTLTKSLSISSNGGFKWFFDNTGTFITRGGSCCGFVGLDPSSDPAVLGAVVQYSASVGFIYSRYAIIKSNRLNENVRTSSRTSGNDTAIVAAVSLVDDYSAADFDTSGAFVGNLSSEKLTDDAPVLNIVEGQKNLNQVDFEIVDEFGFTLDKALQMDPLYPPTSFQTVVWLNLTL